MGSNAPKFDANRPFDSDTNFTDPFGVDPVGRGLHNWVSGWADPPQGKSFADQLAQPGAAKSLNPAGGPPSKAAAADEALQQERDRLKRYNSMSTYLTGGLSSASRPSTASAVLLGS